MSRSARSAARCSRYGWGQTGCSSTGSSHRPTLPRPTLPRPMLKCLTNRSSCAPPAPTRAPSQPLPAATCDGNQPCMTPPSSAAPFPALQGVRPLTLAFLIAYVDNYRIYSFITIWRTVTLRHPAAPCHPSSPPPPPPRPPLPPAPPRGPRHPSPPPPP